MLRLVQLEVIEFPNLMKFYEKEEFGGRCPVLEIMSRVLTMFQLLWEMEEACNPLPALDRKYSDNNFYKQDPVYVAHVLKSAQERQRSHSVEYTLYPVYSPERTRFHHAHIPHE